VLAAEVGAGQPEPVTQAVGERQAGLDLDLVPDAVDPLDDFRCSADYKREMAGVFTRRAVMQALASGEATQ